MNVPDGWTVVRLGQLGKLVGGGTPSRTREDFFGGQIPWLTGQDIPEDFVEIVTKGREQITEEAIRDSATNLVPAGTLLVTTRVSVGKTAVTGCPLCFSQDVSALRLFDSKLASPAFLALYLRFQRERIVSRNQGSTISGITRDGLAAEKLPLPPLKEQDRIVTVLREAAELRRIRTQTKEAAEKLIPSIFNEMFGSGHDSSRHRLDQFAEVVSGVAKGRSVMGGNREVPYMRVANVQAGRLDLSEIKTIPATEAEIEELRLQPGDVLLTEGGDFDKLGRGAIWHGEIQDCIHQNHIFRVRPYPGKLDPVFFSAFLQSAAGRRFFLRAAKRTTNLASINMSQLRALPLPAIPFAQQTKFRKRVEAFEAVMQENASLDLCSEELAVSLNAYAFTGELTARWRERHRSELTAQARERDTALRALGAKLPDASTPTIAERESRAGARKEGAFAELTAQQEALLDELENIAERTAQEAALPGGASTTAHAVFTPASLSAVAPARLRHQPDLIRRELEVLAARGLVLRISRRRHREAYEPDAFGDIYRLPITPVRVQSGFHNADQPEPEVTLVTGEDIRNNELSQLATKLGGRTPV